MNQCVHCKWWQWEPDLHNLVHHPTEEGNRFCENYGSPRFSFYGMHTEGFLETAPNFGCIEWEGPA